MIGKNEASNEEMRLAESSQRLRPETSDRNFEQIKKENKRLNTALIECVKELTEARNLIIQLREELRKKEL